VQAPTNTPAPITIHPFITSAPSPPPQAHDGAPGRGRSHTRIDRAAALVEDELRECQAYLDAVAHAEAGTPGHPSIVNGSIAVERTRSSELFIHHC
jgi:hypothetical protein